MARETGLSKSSVQRLWSTHAIAPHRLKSFKLSKDLAFDEKFWDVVASFSTRLIVPSCSVAMRSASVRPSSAVNLVCP